MTGLLVLAGAASAGFFFVSLLWWRGDDAEFVTLARSIAGGKWMQYINMPGEPRSVKFPFGFPLMLAVVERIAPGNLLAMKALVAFLFVLSVPAIYHLARRSLPSGAAFCVALLGLTNPLLIEFSHHIMSEVPYLLFSLLALIAADHARQTGERLLPAALTALLVVAAITTRAVGLTLGAGLMLSLLLSRKRRATIIVAAGCLVALLLTATLGGPFASALSHSSELDGQNPEFQTYVSRMLQRDPNRQDTASAGVSDLLERAAQNLWAYATIHLPQAPAPLPPILLERIGLTGLAVWVILVLPALALGVALALRQGRPEAWYAVVYLGAVLIWPSRGGAFSRYLVPLIPMLTILFFVGFLTLIQRAGKTPPRAQAIATGLLTGILLLFNLNTTTALTRLERDYPPAWQGYFEVAEWLKHHSSPDTVILARKPFDLSLAAERRTAYFPYSPDSGHLMQLIERYHASYVVIDNLGRPETSRYLVPAIRANGERFDTMYTSHTTPPTYLLRVRDPAGPGEGNLQP